jgi:hypothetical protein
MRRLQNFCYVLVARGEAAAATAMNKKNHDTFSFFGYAQKSLQFFA